MPTPRFLRIVAARWLVAAKTTAQMLPVLALMAALTASGAMGQQSPPKSGMPAAAAKGGMMGGQMAERCQQMMAMHNQMMADRKTMDATLDQKVAAMNAAKGGARVDAMASVINEMATQRKQMMTEMSSMPDKMMAHMGEHMAQSGGTSMSQSMAQCPMMKGKMDMTHK